MKKIIDPVIGELEYKYSWKKKEIFNIWGDNITIILSVNGSENNAVSNIQRNTYKVIKETLSTVLDEKLEMIRKYFEITFKKKFLLPEIISQLQPDRVVIDIDGTWGVLFNCYQDPEHGVVLYCKDESYHVDIQDTFI